jgi:hypothetical protein
MIETRTIPGNTEDHLETPEDIGACLEAVFEDDTIAMGRRPRQ